MWPNNKIKPLIIRTSNYYSNMMALIIQKYFTLHLFFKFFFERNEDP